MKTCIIFHSYTGITRGIARKIQASCGGDLVEVKPRQKYHKLTAYTIGSMRARREEKDPIEPDSLDVAAYDLIVIGTPVWAWKPTPATNAAVSVLKGCEGKRAIIFATCGAQAGDTLAALRKALEEKGVIVNGEAVLTRKDGSDSQKVNALINLVKNAVAS